MVAASSAIRFTRATYSSRTPGRRRERKTVTIMASSIRAHAAASCAADQMYVFDRWHARGRCRGLRRSAGRRLDLLHIAVRQAKMMADLVHQDVGDDLAQRLVVLGPIVQDGSAVEPDHVG